MLCVYSMNVVVVCNMYCGELIVCNQVGLLVLCMCVCSVFSDMSMYAMATWNGLFI
jgi:hypothetical protein